MVSFFICQKCGYPHGSTGAEGCMCGGTTMQPKDFNLVIRDDDNLDVIRTDGDTHGK